MNDIMLQSKRVSGQLEGVNISYHFPLVTSHICLVPMDSDKAGGGLNEQILPKVSNGGKCV